MLSEYAAVLSPQYGESTGCLSSFPSMGFMIGAFYWLFLWDFKKESLSRFYGTAKTKSSRSGRLGDSCLLEIRKEYYDVLLDAGEGFMAWMRIDVVMWIASFAAYI